MSWTITHEVHQLLGQNLERLESPSLRLEKMLYMKEKKDDKGKPKEQDSKGKQIDAVVKCHNSHAKFPAIGFADVPDARRFVMQLGARLLVNHAGGILENTGLCLHRHFGCPYIPGSALKGIARHLAWCHWQEAPNGSDEKRQQALKLALTFGYPAGDPLPRSKKEQEKRASKTDFLDEYLAQHFPHLFGTQTDAAFGGLVSFLPAFPVAVDKQRPLLTKDITTCHHMKYYSNKQPVAFDNEQPNVLPFPAVEAGAFFEFTVVPVRREFGAGRFAQFLQKEFNPLEYALECLQTALEEYGVGAKTATGYGWFEQDQDAEKHVEGKRNAALEAEEERKRLEEEERRRREQLAAMSPVERRAEELGAMTDDDFKGYVKEILNKHDEEKEAMLQALLKHKQHIWLADKNGKKKAAQRADIMRKLAEQFGVDLP